MKIHSNKRLKSVLSAVTARIYSVYRVNVGIVMLDTHIIYTLTNGEVLLLCSIAFSNLAMIIGSDSKQQDWCPSSKTERALHDLYNM